jgi:hypothetical protein
MLKVNIVDLTTGNKDVAVVDAMIINEFLAAHPVIIKINLFFNTQSTYPLSEAFCVSGRQKSGAVVIQPLSIAINNNLECPGIAEPSPDARKNDWRLVLTRDDLDPDKARVIALEGHSITLKVAEDK